MLKRGQTDIILFIALIIGLIIIAPILYQVVDKSLTGFSDALNNTNDTAYQTAVSNVSSIKSSFLTWLDYLIMLIFLADMVSLFVFSFLVDTHPIFSLFYLFSAVFALIFMPYIVEPAKQLFGMSWFSDAVVNLPLTNFVLTKFSIIILGIIIVNGIIMYAKFRGGGQNYH